VPVIFVSLEEPPSRLALKAICSRAGLIMQRFAEGRAEAAAVEDAIARFGNELACLRVMEADAQTTVDTIEQHAQSVMEEADADRCMVIVDYLQRWVTADSDSEQFQREVGDRIVRLRRVAGRLDSPVIVTSSLAHFSSDQENPTLEEFRDSGQVEYSADTALVLFEPEPGILPAPARRVVLYVAKNRFGEAGRRIVLQFRPDLGVIQEIDETY
jgi:replicative DNA helicase